MKKNVRKYLGCVGLHSSTSEDCPEASTCLNPVLNERTVAVQKVQNRRSTTGGPSDDVNYDDHDCQTPGESCHNFSGQIPFPATSQVQDELPSNSQAA